MSRKSVAVSVAVLFQPTPCRWQINRANPNKLYLRASNTADEARPVAKDAWAMRDAFLSLGSSEQLLAFLNLNGRFTHYADEESWSLEDFEGWREIVRRLSQVKPENWAKLVLEHFGQIDHSRLIAKFEGDFRVSFGKVGKFYIGRIDVKTVLQAMIASVYIDWMAGVKMGFCTRQDCRKPYEVTSSHKRKYCSPECAHYEVVRRGRERKRVAAKAVPDQKPSTLRRKASKSA